MAKVKVARNVVAVGLEYYADLGPIAGVLPPSQEAHYLFEAADLLSIKSFELNIGVGEGLTPGEQRGRGQMILGFRWPGTRKTNEGGRDEPRHLADRAETLTPLVLDREEGAPGIHWPEGTARETPDALPRPVTLGRRRRRRFHPRRSNT